MSKLTVRLDIRVEPECHEAIVEFGKKHKWRRSQSARELLELGLLSVGYQRDEKTGVYHLKKSKG